jgi:hypothetical protein
MTAGFWLARSRARRLNAGIYAGMRLSIPVKMT